MILQRTGDNFGGRGRATIDQHNQRLLLGQIANIGVVTVSIFGVTTPGTDNFPLVEKRIRDPNCLRQQPAGVVAQI